MGKEYIDRDAVIENIKQVYCTGCNSYNGVMCRACQIDDAILQIDAEPAADVVPVVHGEWEYYTHTMMACSICKRHVPRHKSEYCPHCGAKMDGGANGTA